MQEVDSDGISASTASGQRQRCTVTRMHNAVNLPEDVLYRMWGNKSLKQAYDTLAMDDVLVTNQQDKVTQLRTLNELNDQIKSLVHQFKAEDEAAKG